MKIYVNATFLCSEYLTGLARFAINICLELKKCLKDDLIIVAPNAVPHSDIADSLGVKRIGVNKHRVLWEQIDLPFYLKSKGSPLLLSLGNTAPLLYDNQVVSVLDLFFQRVDNVLQENQKAYSWATTQYFKVTTPIIISQAKKVITISNYSKQDIVNIIKCDPEKIEIVYPYLSNSFIHKNESFYENKYGKYILGVSALTPRKNFDGLIKAYKMASFYDTKLVIVGAYEKTMKDYPIFDLCKNDPNIVFTGYVTDEELISIYKNALFFAYPSFLEGFGIPPLEAMACGCPTLVSNVTSLPEVCGDASVYVDPYNVENIVEGMKKLYNDKVLRETLVLNGYKRLPIFDKENTIKNLIDLLSSVNN
ncbi:glycosyltransferase family 1 protein [Nibrella viscosa]|uniref:Glycosyltransferase family 1 protein n=1 Tax=Nibrella viscosa TaxID=1084524 RepID=A0ABP8KIT6_9BACT